MATKQGIARYIMRTSAARTSWRAEEYRRRVMPAARTPRVLSGGGGGFLEETREILCRDRPPNEEPLCACAAVRTQELELLDGLDALRDDFEIETARERERRADDNDIVIARRNPA